MFEDDDLDLDFNESVVGKTVTCTDMKVNDGRNPSRDVNNIFDSFQQRPQQPASTSSGLRRPSGSKDSSLSPPRTTSYKQTVDSRPVSTSFSRLP